jgi:AraC family transcriptional regulator
VIVRIVKMPSETWAYLKFESSVGSGEINEQLERGFAQLTERIARGGIRTQGQPRAHFHYRDGARVGFEIGFPIDSSEQGAARRARLEVGIASPGDALMHIHRGPYGRLRETYREMESTISRQGFLPRGDLWEVYLNDPDECEAGDLLTQVVWPIEEKISALGSRT